MKRILLILTILTISLTTIWGKEKPKEAPKNPEFEKYLENKSSLKNSSGNYKTGYIPMYFAPQFDNISVNLKSTEELPESYDLRDYNHVSSVKNQGNWGTCWSFAAMGSIESTWKKMGLNEEDLSELNMVTCHGFGWGLDDGGNPTLAIAYLTRLNGPVAEIDDPYASATLASTCKSIKDKVAYVTEARLIPNNQIAIKQAIMQYGAVATSMHVSNNYSQYYNANDYTFYYGGTESIDHGVLIVGWNDNIEITGGMQSPKVTTTGAWIIKNSWGTGFGDNGYFYIAYDDTKVASRNSVYPVREETNEIDTIFMHDKLGQVTSYGFGKDTAYALVKFEANEEMLITKIGTFTSAAGTIISAEIYDDFDGTSLSNLVTELDEQLCEHPGYYTFNMPDTVSGDFYIKVKYITPNYNYPVPVERKVSWNDDGKEFVWANPIIESGVCWIKSSESYDWQALGSDTDYNYDLCIRAYGKKSTSPNVSISSSTDEICKGSTVTYSATPIGDVNSLEWNFGEDATPSNATGYGPHEVSYSTAGFKDIELTINEETNNTYFRSVKVVEDLYLFTNYSNVEVVKGKTITLIASGADTYEWSPSTGLNKADGNIVEATIEEDIVYTVTGTMGTCSGSAEIAITSKLNPENDDVCDAFELSYGKNGPFTNKNATTQDGEPHPPASDDGCNKDGYWCSEEPALDNSVWFKFTANGDIASIDAPGFDNQIAVYSATSCDDILNDNYELIAAYDDYYGETDFFAAAVNLSNLTEGTEYWVQIDGSAGGSEGDFHIYLENSPLSIEDIPNQTVSVFPNPNSGEFEIKFNQVLSETVIIEIYNSNGTLVQKTITSGLQPSESLNIQLNNKYSGIYILKIREDKNVIMKKIIVN